MGSRGEFVISSVIGACLLLSACGGQKTPPFDTGNSSSSSASSGGPTPPPSPPPPPPPPPCNVETPGGCFGPLEGRLTGVTLQWDGEPGNNGDRRISGSATLTLKNRAAEAVQIALLNGEVTLKYINGTVLKLDHQDDEKVSGIQFCGFDGTSCVNKGKQSFTTVSPGDSPVGIEFKFYGRVKASEIPSLAGATAASMSASLWVIHTEPEGYMQTVSIQGASVANATVQ